LFTAGIVGIVVYFSVTKADTIPSAAAVDTDEAMERGGLWQTVVVVALILVAAGTGYSLRKSSLQGDSAADVQSMPGGSQAAQLSPLGDLSKFREITQDTLGLSSTGDQSGATARVKDLETEWDNSEARLKPRDEATWSNIDDKIDAVLRALRATSP